MDTSGDARRLDKLEAFGWRLGRAVLPYGALVLGAGLVLRLVLDPSWAAAALGALAGGGATAAWPLRALRQRRSEMRSDART